MTFLELKIPPALLLILFMLMMTFQPFELMVVALDPQYLGITIKVIVGLGMAIIIAAIVSFKVAKTTVDPTAPEKASTLVQSGIFNYSRNPMYLGFSLFLLALAIYTQTLAAFIVVIMFVRYLHYFQIKPEERMLTQVFGQTYVDYCQRVRRWF